MVVDDQSPIIDDPAVIDSLKRKEKANSGQQVNKAPPSTRSYLEKDGVHVPLVCAYQE